MKFSLLSRLEKLEQLKNADKFKPFLILQPDDQKPVNPEDFRIIQIVRAENLVL